jgi:hypothetical protein
MKKRCLYHFSEGPLGDKPWTPHIHDTYSPVVLGGVEELVSNKFIVHLNTGNPAIPQEGVWVSFNGADPPPDGVRGCYAVLVTEPILADAKQGDIVRVRRSIDSRWYAFKVCPACGWPGGCYCDESPSNCTYCGGEYPCGCPDQMPDYDREEP